MEVPVAAAGEALDVVVHDVSVEEVVVLVEVVAAPVPSELAAALEVVVLAASEAALVESVVA